ncbi:Uncharacterized protein Adt_23398 [Abeliophyllum distichum]|uniref:Uncharacterized protein n=1 Tax=Abeliophyllum distichum TaxID=126358 RepID=A0ABD1SBU8_9LAMI
MDELTRTSVVCEISTIFRGPYVGRHTMNSRQNCSKAAREEPMESWQVYEHRPNAPQITFTEKNEVGIHYLHCDALVVRAVVARNGAVVRVHRRQPRPTTKNHPCSGLQRAAVPTEEVHGILNGRYPLCLSWGPGETHAQRFVGSHLHPLLSNEVFDPNDMVKVCSNQIEARSCYMNTLRKSVKHEEISSTIMMVQTESMDVDPEQADEEMILDEGLDPRIIGSDSSTSPTEEPETFPVIWTPHRCCK